MNEEHKSALLGMLSEVFGAHKAEWLGPRLFELFTEPSYFPRMTTARPCVLVGGRGTGKTTVLRSLSYEGQFAIRKNDIESIHKWPYYGLYYRVDTNRVTAFQGPELSELQWTRTFAHYINLLICMRVMKFLSWFGEKTSINTEIDLADRKCIAGTLNIQVPDNNKNLSESLQQEMGRFEAHINNIASSSSPMQLSMQGAPIQALLEALNKQPALQDKLFFFLIDEYENLQDYQQRLMNTLIKHSGELHTFKIGVRELGWRLRTTLNENEQLISPADYIRIDITQALTGNQFEDLAFKICQDRLSLVVSEQAQQSGMNIRNLLPELSEEQEAKLLGIEAPIDTIVKKMKVIDKHDILSDLSPLTIYLLDYWSKIHNQSYEEILEDFYINRNVWNTRKNNYQYSLLFTIKKGKRGIRKFYSGWGTFLQLSGGNIRYLLQLVEESLSLHLREGKLLTDPVSADIQTDASQRVGRVNLTELEGLAVRGAKLTKLLLGLGRIFGVMAETPEGHTPEVNQFEIVDSPGITYDQQEVDAILKAAVMHLALIRSSGSKPADKGDTRDWDYMMHPIFAPFFNFSYRRKRKMQLSGHQVLSLVMSPKKAIREILSANNRNLEGTLPEQMQLFEMYYAEQA